MYFSHICCVQIAYRSSFAPGVALMEMCIALTSSMLARGKYTSERSSFVKIHGLETSWKPLAKSMRFSASA